jgi:TolB-like protein/class 3 adenylate cyclase/cytochrome c-type biogenesis protein CcmH/NrfG
MTTSPSNIKTVLELDLAAYSDIASALEENLDVQAVKTFQDQIQSFVDEGLNQLGIRRDDVVFATAGDNALLIFDDPSVMHHFAKSVQEATVRHNRKKSVESAKRWFRMGAATGSVLVIADERRIVGTTVARAVRLEAAAEKGELLIDTETFDALPDELKSCYGAEEVIAGKREELFTVRRCAFVAPSDRLRKVNGHSSSAASQRLSPAQKSLAVLPFVNMSDDRENEFLCDGITEDIIIALSRVTGIRVPARTSSFVFKGRNEDVRQIGRLLDVETVLEGSVRKSGNKLRITAQLVNVNADLQLWSKRYDREMKDVFDIQDDIARAIVGELHIQLGGGSEMQYVRPQTTSTTAYELYLKGRIHWNTRGKDLIKALHYYELALLEDPAYSLAYSGIADTFVLLGFYDYMASREALAKANIAAQKAVELDVNSAESHAALGVVQLFYDWDFIQAKVSLEQSLSLNPGNSFARGWLALCLLEEGRDMEALEQVQLGVKADPLSPFANVHFSYIHIMLGQYVESFPALQRCLELFPNSPMGHWLLGQAYWFTEKREMALTELQRAVELSGRNPMILSSLGWALAQSGAIDHAREIQSELVERTSPAPTRSLFLAVIHAGFGEKDQAFDMLERAFMEREFWLPHPHAMTGLGVLKSDPRWPEFVRKVKTARLGNA